jgi:ribosomal protein S18 acetylase RimI-like enzyme
MPQWCMVWVELVSDTEAYVTHVAVEALIPNGIGSADLEQVNGLLAKSYPRSEPLSAADARLIAQNDHLFVARLGGREIVGMATFAVFRTVAGLVGQVRNIAVAEKCRGAYVERRLMGAVIEVAQSRNLKRLELVCAPKDVAAFGFDTWPGFEPDSAAHLALRL